LYIEYCPILRDIIEKGDFFTFLARTFKRDGFFSHKKGCWPSIFFKGGPPAKGCLKIYHPKKRRPPGSREKILKRAAPHILSRGKGGFFTWEKKENPP